MNLREQYQKETGKNISPFIERMSGHGESYDIDPKYVEWLEKKLEKSKSLNDLYGMGVTEWKTKDPMMTPAEIAEYRKLSNMINITGFNNIS